MHNACTLSWLTKAKVLLPPLTHSSPPTAPVPAISERQTTFSSYSPFSSRRQQKKMNISRSSQVPLWLQQVCNVCACMCVCVCVCVCVCMCVCVCVRERERERESACECMCMYSVHEWVQAMLTRSIGSRHDWKEWQSGYLCRGLCHKHSAELIPPSPPPSLPPSSLPPSLLPAFLTPPCLPHSSLPLPLLFSPLSTSPL